MKMTFDSYIANPMGEKNAVMSNREMYRGLYTEKLDKILLREAGKIDYFLYNSNQDRYFIHIKIPDEVYPNFYYDTVIEFYTDDKEVKESKLLKKYFVKFYSNDPSFVYTFAYAFISHDLFIKELLPKMSSQARKKPASVKNAGNNIGYVKSIYFAYLIIKNRGLDNKVQFESYSEKFSSFKLSSRVLHANKKLEARQELDKQAREKKKKEKAAQIDKDNSNRKLSNVQNKPESRVRTVKKIEPIKPKNSTNKSNSRVHKVKKI